MLDEEWLKESFNFSQQEKSTVKVVRIDSKSQDNISEGSSKITVDKKSSLLSKLFSFIFTLLLIGVLLLAALISIIPKMQKGASLTVLTQSMQPKINPGDMVAVVPKPCSELHIDDIITYHPYPDDPTTITHRIIEKNVGGKAKCTFKVKGDNNTDPDSTPVTFEMIAGKVIYVIPKMGFLAQGAQGKTPYLSPIIAGVLILYSVFLFFKPNHKKVVKESKEE